MVSTEEGQEACPLLEAVPAVGARSGALKTKVGGRQLTVWSWQLFYMHSRRVSPKCVFEDC